jgi:hypothetical protein
MPQPGRTAVGDGRADHAGVRMNDEHHAIQFFCIQGADDVLNVRLQVDVAVQQMGAVAHASERDCVHLMPLRTQHRGNALPTPSARPSPMYQHKTATGAPQKHSGKSCAKNHQLGAISAM